MPELAEVETVRRGLAKKITSKTITAVTVLHPRPVRRHSAGIQDFEKTLVGRTFAEPKRRGKFMWFPFADGDALIAHLGMSGQFRVFDDGVEPHSKHTRVVFSLDSGESLEFVDTRMFGGLWLSPGGAERPPEIEHIAADPFSADYSQEELAKQIAGSGRAIKRLLLDQGVVSGIGNIYADESLWRAEEHYLTTGVEMGVTRASRLLDAVKAVLSEAIAAGGTSFDALYVNADGEPGYFERSLDVYGREGQPCHRCGTQIVREPFMGRSSFLCPRCQVRE
ncbi:MAG: bifunctional DNA-formamidopyrimidine glycosylase/DNA-(apurinic or apyrimidinic site) lyase [Propionibacteriaceae bacterium]|jgi:formamidopyrimidine-DNA glycosylase|nr:bifunctional DNA-formamidopyrimidine glycosylase/DNA-(apurinic or apyrimidinic site) lyase [Propionibacteriaceae bacterium]